VEELEGIETVFSWPTSESTIHLCDMLQKFAPIKTNPFNFVRSLTRVQYLKKKRRKDVKYIYRVARIKRAVVSELP